MFTVQRELTLHELLRDPLVRIVMERDGLAPAHFEAMFETMRHPSRDRLRRTETRQPRELA